MIVITGAAGFIASNLVRSFMSMQTYKLLLVDVFAEIKNSGKTENIADFRNLDKIERTVFPEWFAAHASEISFVFHLGARTDTTEFDFHLLEALNLNYSKQLFNICAANKIPFVYASSAATYGLGENGFDDQENNLSRLKPLNPYGLSKHLFDLYAAEQNEKPPFWAGLKFFNVYGPHEAHKGRMASVVFHAYNQIHKTRKLKLFKSLNSAYADGEQLRDFIYVSDVIEICLFMFDQCKASGIYNVGTGKARSFNDLGKAVFASIGYDENIEYIPVPEDICDKYQYFTEAKIDKLTAAGFNRRFTSLEEGIKTYIKFLEQTTRG